MRRNSSSTRVLAQLVELGAAAAALGRPQADLEDAGPVDAQLGLVPGPERRVDPQHRAGCRRALPAHASPSGPSTRTVERRRWRTGPRRVGRMAVRTSRRAVRPARVTRARRVPACSDGASSSAKATRWRATGRVGDLPGRPRPSAPSAMTSGTVALDRRSRRGGRPAPSRPAASDDEHGRRPTRTPPARVERDDARPTAQRRSDAARGGGCGTGDGRRSPGHRARRRGCRRARRRRWPPPARARGAAGCGGAAPAWPRPSPRRGSRSRARPATPTPWPRAAARWRRGATRRAPPTATRAWPAPARTM